MKVLRTALARTFCFGLGLMACSTLTFKAFGEPQRASRTHRPRMRLDNNLKCVDLTDPALPFVRGTLDPDGRHRALTASGDTLYMLSTGSGLHTVNAADVDDLLLLDSDVIAVSTLLDIHTDGDCNLDTNGDQIRQMCLKTLESKQNRNMAKVL